MVLIPINATFRCLTPHDINWMGLAPSTDDERREFARELVAACRDKSIDAIAVTIISATVRGVAKEKRRVSWLWLADALIRGRVPSCARH